MENITDKIIELCSEAYGVSIEDMKSRTREGNIPEARFLAFCLLREYTKYSYKAIGAIFNREHCTVITGIKAFKNFIEFDKQTLARYNDVNEQVAEYAVKNVFCEPCI